MQKKDFVSLSKKVKLLAVAVNGRQPQNNNIGRAGTELVYQVKGVWL